MVSLYSTFIVLILRKILCRIITIIIMIILILQKKLRFRVQFTGTEY